eukprot:13404281-Alexandrium_andersonii.AAC.1
MAGGGRKGVRGASPPCSSPARGVGAAPAQTRLPPPPSAQPTQEEGSRAASASSSGVWRPSPPPEE